MRMAATMDERLARTFVELADTLVAGYDLAEFLQALTERCAELLEVDAAGLLLADGPGALRLVAASTEQARVVELFQVQHRQGPCPGSRSSSVTSARRKPSRGGRGSRRPRGRQGSPGCTRSRCGCAIRSSGPSTCSAARLAAWTQRWPRPRAAWWTSPPSGSCTSAPCAK